MVLSAVPAASAASVTKGPYLIYRGTPTEMQVLWQADASATATLQWGLDTNYTGGSVNSTEYGSDHQHAHTITGLAPGTLYRYRVQISGENHTGSFRTAPPATATRAKFLVFGDTRSEVVTMNNVCGKMVEAYTADPEYQTFTLHQGDWVQRDQEVHWGDSFFARTALNAVTMMKNLPIQGCRGNHEDSATYYQKYWPYPYVGGRGYWSFDYGPAHVVVIDQYDVTNGPSQTQVNWVAADLAATSRQWKIMVLHEPGWSAGAPDHVGGHPNNLRVQEVLQPLCENYGVDFVFSAHNHFYARCTVNGVHHITSAGGGAPLYDPRFDAQYLVTATKAHHFCQVAIDGNQATLVAKAVNGATLDSLTVTHGDTESLTFTSLAQEDGYVIESAQGSNVGGSCDAGLTGGYGMRVGDTSSKQQQMIIVSFDTSGIPDGATITSAQLRLTHGGISNSPANFGPLRADICTDGFNGNAALENADFEAASTHAQVATMTYPTSDGEVSTGDLNTEGLSAISKTGKTQLRIRFTNKTDDDGSSDYLGFYPGNNENDAYRPKLVVNFTSASTVAQWADYK